MSPGDQEPKSTRQRHRRSRNSKKRRVPEGARRDEEARIVFGRAYRARQHEGTHATRPQNSQRRVLEAKVRARLYVRTASGQVRGGKSLGPIRQTETNPMCPRRRQLFPKAAVSLGILGLEVTAASGTSVRSYRPDPSAVASRNHAGRQDYARNCLRPPACIPPPRPHGGTCLHRCDEESF